MERKNRIFKSFSTALIAIMMFTAMMPSWAYGETAGSGAAVQTAEQQAAQPTASAPVIKNDISEQKASYAVGDTAKALTVTASSDDGGELSSLLLSERALLRKSQRQRQVQQLLSQ